jgi:hypothetical protein
VRGVAFLIAVALILVPAIGMAAEPAAVEGPRLAPGDFWTYRTNTSLAAGLSLDGRVTLSLADRSAIAVEGTPYDVYNLSLSGSGTAAGRIETRLGSANASGSWILTGWQLTEVRGLTRLWTVVDLEANGTVDTKPAPLPFALRVQNTTRFRLESDPWSFPLRVGDSATVAGRMNFTEDVGLSYGFPTTPKRTVGVAWWNRTFTLGPAARVNTSLGTFDTFPIDETDPDGISTRLFFAPVAGNYARTETRNGTSELGTSDLVAYRYQALEPSRFLGLTLDQWAIAAAGIAAGAAAFVWWRRRRKKRGTDGAVPPTPP